MGLIWALMSVLLVSVAQLLLRGAMVTLPPVAAVRTFLLALAQGEPGTVMLLCGLLGYLASMGCWFLALRRLPLSKAYALLSLSYILVWAAAIVLPGWHESFSWWALAGVVTIMTGVVLIFLPSSRN